MLRKVTLFTILIVTLIPVWQTASAQTAKNPPLIVQIRRELGSLAGDLFALTASGAGTLTRLTNYGYNEAPNLSPDGKTVAYSSYSSQ